MSNLPSLFARVSQAVSPRFRLRGEVAAGGMGVVFDAEDTDLERRVAIKVPRPELFTAVFAERFVREARALAAIRHPNVVTIFDARTTNGLSLLVMEFIEGPTLQQLLSRGAMEPPQVHRIAVQLAGALEVIHARGIVHCDIKPANIFLEGDRAVLSDFGIAALVDQSSGTSTAERFVGTPEYMSPEQRARQVPGPASDIYSLGLVLRECLTGLRPSEHDGGRVASGPHTALDALLPRMLATEPHERPSARALHKALERSVGPAQWSRRSARLLAALALLLAIPLGMIYGRELNSWLGEKFKGKPLPAVAIARIGADGRDSLALQLTRLLEKNLEWFAPLSIAGAVPGQDRGQLRAQYVVQGDVKPRDGRLTVDLAVLHEGKLFEVVKVSGDEAALEQMACAITDSLIRKVFRARYVEYTGFAHCRVGNVQAANSYFRGVEAFRRGDWAGAETEFTAAVERDPGMLQAVWELMIAQRFQRKDETATLRRLLRARDSLPPFYLALVEAQLTPDIRRRFQRYEAVLGDYQRTSKALLLYTNERFHRGPLVGSEIRATVDTMSRLAQLDPDMNHTSVYDISLWGHIRLGDEDAAWTDYTRRQRLVGPGDRYGPFQRLAIWARFTPWWAHTVQVFTFRNPDDTTLRALTELTRLGTWFDIPGIQDDLGQVLARHGRNATQRGTGYVAQAGAHLLQGRTTAGLVLLDSGAAFLPTPEMRLQQREWPVMLAALGIPVAPSVVAEAARWLQYDAPASPRVPWTLGIHALTIADTVAAIHWLHELEAQSSSSEVARRLAALLAAHLLADPRAALDTTAVIFLLDSAATQLSPFTRVVTYLGRARWQRALGDHEAASRELLWYENADQVGWPMNAPQQGEVDAILSAYARLVRGELAAAHHDPAACTDLDRVAVLWRRAEPAMAPLVNRLGVARKAALCRP